MTSRIWPDSIFPRALRVFHGGKGQGTPLRSRVTSAFSVAVVISVSSISFFETLASVGVDVVTRKKDTPLLLPLLQTAKQSQPYITALEVAEKVGYSLIDEREKAKAGSP